VTPAEKFDGGLDLESDAVRGEEGLLSRKAIEEGVLTTAGCEM
jgi:hypothetical protein